MGANPALPASRPSGLGVQQHEGHHAGELRGVHQGLGRAWAADRDVASCGAPRRGPVCCTTGQVSTSGIPLVELRRLQLRPASALMASDLLLLGPTTL